MALGHPGTARGSPADRTGAVALSSAIPPASGKGAKAELRDDVRGSRQRAELLPARASFARDGCTAELKHLPAISVVLFLFRILRMSLVIFFS